MYFLTYCQNSCQLNKAETKSDTVWQNMKRFKLYWCLHFIGHKILKYFNEFHNWHFSVSLQKWAQTKIKIKQYMCKSVNTFPCLQSRTLFKWLLKFISWISGNSSKGRMSIASFHSAIFKRNWAHLAGKTSWPWATTTSIFRLMWRYFDCINIKTFSKHLFCFEHQNHMTLWRRTSIYNKPFFLS